MTAKQIQARFASIQEEGFQSNWSKFSPVIFLPVDDNDYKIAYRPGPMCLIVK